MTSFTKRASTGAGNWTSCGPLSFGSVAVATFLNPLFGPSVDVQISTSFGNRSSTGLSYVGTCPCGGSVTVTPETSATSRRKNDTVASAGVLTLANAQYVFGLPSSILMRAKSPTSREFQYSMRPPISSAARLSVRGLPGGVACASGGGIDADVGVAAVAA